MYKIRKITFKDHPILKNLELDFCGEDGRAVDTIILAGENGTGKSTILDSIYQIITRASKFDVDVELEVGEEVRKLTYRRETNASGALLIRVKDNKGKLFFNSNVLEDFKTNTFSRYLLLPNASQKINLDPHEIKITGVKRPNGNRRVFVPKVKIIIRDMSGKTYVFRQKMQEAKMGEAIFGAAFFAKED